MTRSATHKIGAALAAAALVAMSTGCATKGFVKKEMTSLENRMAPATQQAQADARSAQTLAQGADARARQVEIEAQMARDLALGNIKREEVRRVTVNFEFDSAEIPEESQSALDAVASDLQQNLNYMALVTGYTDATGDELYNIGLAQRRAAAVQYHLASQLGNDFVRLATIGFGEIQPVGDNSTREGRALNRRTEVILVRPAPAPAGSSELPPTALRP
jgi:outer membrane protein OmpA-like peptidoglycan-associated protein